MEVVRGGPTSDPSLFKLKLSVTLDFSTPAGGFQHDMIAAPTWSMVVSGSAWIVSGTKNIAAEQAMLSLTRPRVANIRTPPSCWLPPSPVAGTMVSRYHRQIAIRHTQANHLFRVVAFAASELVLEGQGEARLIGIAILPTAVELG